MNQRTLLTAENSAAVNLPQGKSAFQQVVRYVVLLRLEPSVSSSTTYTQPLKNCAILLSSVKAQYCVYPPPKNCYNGRFLYFLLSQCLCYSFSRLRLLLRFGCLRIQEEFGTQILEGRWFPSFTAMLPSCGLRKIKIILFTRSCFQIIYSLYVFSYSGILQNLL